jgi:hypothetical protein
VIRFLADEDFNHDIVMGVLRLNPNIDILSVQEAGLGEEEDPGVLEWAASTSRVLLSHDVNTMSGSAYERIRQGRAMPGLFLVRQHTPIGPVIEDLLLIAECSLEGEWEGQVRYLPL